MKRAAALLVTITVITLLNLQAATAEPGLHTRNVILLTVDGMRIEEIFGGIDGKIIGNQDYSGIYYDSESDRVLKAYGGPTPQASREKLLPYFWQTFVPNGVLIGDPDRNSHVLVTNTEKFSAPGYMEILTGQPHAEVVSNDNIRYPFPTLLEYAHDAMHLDYTGVATIGSWIGFATLSSSRAKLFFTNAGFEPVPDKYATPQMKWLNGIQDDIMTLWPEGRSDAVTFAIATDYLRKYHPRLLYIALDESDDWAHEKRYDRYLDYIHLFDSYLQRLWTQLQSMEQYRDKTTLIITTDHGRGHDPRQWGEHGAGEELKGSESIWIAVAGPDTPHRGDLENTDATQSQVAATALRFLGLDYRKFNPQAAKPIDAAFPSR